MEQQPQSVLREHHFYVSVAKFLFLHPEHGVVSVRDPIRLKDAQRYGLSPILLYGLTVPGLPIRWLTFTSVGEPRAFRDVLLEAWGKAEGLRGLPDILRVNRHLAAASPHLARDMSEIGVQVEVADAREKSHPASLRSAQHYSRWLPRRHDGNDPSITDAIEALCRDAQHDHDYHIRDGHRGLHGPGVEDRIQRWLALPAKEPVPTGDRGLDWEPSPWLSSWEASLAPEQPRYFDISGFHDSTWLLTGEKAPEDIVDDADLWADNDYDNGAEVARNLVACWPNPPVEIARCVGLSLRELQWFISGKAHLDPRVRCDLEKLLGIEYNEDMSTHVGASPCVLVAKRSPAVKAVYESISGGGDACPCEVVPSQGPADPSWRYVLINPYGKPSSVLVAPRGAAITERLPDLLLNYAGITFVSKNFYRDLVSTCSKASRDPSANIREMRAFVKRYKECWANGYWQPE
jgi:hypothetical protein